MCQDWKSDFDLFAKSCFYRSVVARPRSGTSRGPGHCEFLVVLFVLFSPSAKKKRVGSDKERNAGSHVISSENDVSVAHA